MEDDIEEPEDVIYGDDDDGDDEALDLPTGFRRVTRSGGGARQPGLLLYMDLDTESDK